MYPGDFEKSFRKIVEIFTLDFISEKKELEQSYPKRNPNTPIWDTIDILEHLDSFIDIGDGKYVSCKNFFKRPIRIMFFFLIIELESRIFRILEWSRINLKELNEKSMNNLIIDLANSELINFQNIYNSRAEFKEDLKAISSFRNIIVHINKKLSDYIDNKTILNRKKQLNKLLSATQQILDEMEIRYEKEINKLSQEQIKDLKSSILNHEESLKKIYAVRRVRDLTGNDGILQRTIGDDYTSPSSYNEFYFDKKRGKNTRTELAETLLALKEYDKEPLKKNKIKLLVEIGDILNQKKIINLFHKKHSSYLQADNILNSILEYFYNELKKRNINSSLVPELAKTKCGIKAWLREHGFTGKDKKLEYFLCEEKFNELSKD
jgi:hypothetical protein